LSPYVYLALTQGGRLLVINELIMGGLVNPIWCSYRTAPSSAFLIGQDGIIHTAQIWLHVGEMKAVIDDLLE
jgi:hypothetical protein